MERNRQRWREAVALAEPESIKKKEFTSKCGLPRLDNYDVCKYPKEYWDKWPKYGLENLPNRSWIIPEKVTKLCCGSRIKDLVCQNVSNQTGMDHGLLNILPTIVTVTARLSVVLQINL